MLVTIKNLQVQYGSQTALSIDTPIVINEGERIGIIGSNGAGKTTLVKAILGLVPYRGSIVSNLKPEDMAVHMQFNEYVNTMPVRMILETILDTSIWENKELQELIAYFEFEKCLKKRYSQLSGGQKQRFTIIMVMLSNAPLTFYDEVTSGLDFETRQRLMEKLVHWYAGKKNTLCIISHYYEELEVLADKLLILDEGKVVDYGKKDELFHKYCGNAVYIIDNTEANRELFAEIPKLNAPEHLLALSCLTMEEEKVLTGRLLEADVNFKRSTGDIEIMSANAKKAYREREGICV